MSAENGGAYRLFIRLSRAARLRPGALGPQRLEPGLYVYVGSARRHLTQRVARHRRLATEKAGNRHWHVDALLLHRYARLVQAETLPGADECRLAAELAADPAVSVPIRRFGATDCRSGCPAHLFRLDA